MPLPRRRFVLLLVAIGAAQANAGVERDEAFPYTAYVVEDDVYVRSGPGKNYYPTSKLNRGATIEVYRHDADGWYAIRPPEGSFSWVSGEWVSEPRDNLSTVTGERVVARVGSQFSDIRDVIQVRLDRGEEVEVLEAKQFNTPPAAQTWYRISPPAGEFRWVSGQYVDVVPPDEARKEPESQGNPIVDQHQSDPSADPTIDRDDDADQFPPRSGRGQEEESLGTDPGSSSSRDESDRLADHVGSRAAATRALKPFEEELEDINLELSTIVAEEPTVWQFDRLQRRAKAALDRAETAVERGQARRILNKIARFDDIRERYHAVGDLKTNTDERERRLSTASRDLRDTDPSRANLNYDGTGRLTRVVSSRTGAPRYALLDEQGAVRYYVTPAPGVNLRHLEGRNVGITGTRGYSAEYRAQHLTAKRIAPLDGPTLR